ncbi:MAG: hypothetical protein J1G01_01545 [Clostridiales bacterium]|nr:hypothetical protein [Clostridiales bacterium]
MKINALCTSEPIAAKKYCDRIVTTCSGVEGDGFTVIKEYSPQVKSGDIYIPTMLDEDVLGSACDYIVTTGARAVVRTAFDLEESGIIEAKYKLSPIMLLHKLGVLGNCTIAGGVCLDNDDLDLMAQENVPLILLPTADAGYGHGFAPVCAAVRRGIRIGIGTLDGKYNKKANLDYELEFLRLTANAEMSVENALSNEQLKKILAFA